MKKKVNYEENLKTPQILTKETYMMRGFLMENSKIRLVIVMLTTKDSSNFNRGNVNCQGNLYEKKEVLKKKVNYEENLKTSQILTKEV